MHEKSTGNPNKLAANTNISLTWSFLFCQMPGCEGGAAGVSVLVPADFLNRLSRDVVRMTEGERHGVR